MIKTYKRAIALFVAFAFLSLLQISAMPARAEQAPGPTGTSVENPENAPSFIEEEGDTSYTPKKKSILPIILGVLAVGAVVAVLALVVLKTKYDITGKWTLTWQYVGDPQYSNTITFTGDKKTGTFSIGTASGTYTVDSKKVQWVYSNGQTTYTGEFSDKTHISGTMVSYGYAGTWSAVKQATSSDFSAPAAAGKTASGEKQR